jgi:integrase
MVKRRRPYPYLKRDVSRHGQVRWYFLRDGRKTRLPDYPGASKEAEAAYYAALDEKPIEKAVGEARFAPGTFGHLCGRYLSSPGFVNRAPLTQDGYRRQIDRLREEFGKIPLKQFERRHIVAIVERKADKPGAANNVLKVLKILFSYALKADLIDRNPAAGVEKQSYRVGGAETWREEHAAMFQARWPLGCQQRTLFEIMWNTGLRIGDALKLGPQHIRDGRVRMVTSKTGDGIDLPLREALREALDAAPTPHLTYLATAQGRTRSAKAAYTWFSAAAKAAGLPKGFTAHGCRKGLLTAMAEARATEQQMQAVSGIRSPRVLQGYIREANKARLADDGMSVLDDLDRGENGTKSSPPSKKVGRNGK